MPYPLPHALAPLCLLRCVSLLPHPIDYRRARFLLALRLAGRSGSSSRPAISLSSNRICGAASVACLPSPGAMSMLSHLISRLISSIITSIVSSPLFDTIGRGVWRGAAAFSACLASSCGLCRCLPVSIAGSFRFHPLRCYLSVCLPVGSAAGTIAFSSHPCGMCCDALLARWLVSRRLPSRRSGRFIISLSPSLATR